ncbi:ABC transporter ATP-binding protein [Actinotalea caeni]|uniref:ABC transporter ATP-binding protein n=1 Tax=Actinotalea caeni TaxID=1348467 RepID=UPI0012E17ED6|nr:ATP-binding cassette domain-containing protein [Actinotalea caeni]
MIEVADLTKRYGSTTAVDGLTFTVRPGAVTGFLGPNGAGKSTTMRMIVGLARPTSGSARVNGHAYADLRAPLQEVGVMLDGRTVHPGRTAWGHLMGLARTHGIGRARVQQVIELAGLTSVARRRVGGFSLGMTQRLGIAAALLGDPPTVVLDEPVNGLDPDGVLWIRGLLRSLADDGRTVFLSSHLMSELAAVANRVVVIGRGVLLADDDIDALVTRSARDGVVRVRSAEPERLGRALAAAGATVRPVDGDLLEVTGTDAGTVGALAAELGVPVLELGTVAGTLEEAYLDLTADAVEYGGTGARAAAGDRS